MPTAKELGMVHVAAKQAGLNEEMYRLMLRSVAGVGSAKELTQGTLEDVMACLEDSGFRHVGKPADYWRMKVATRGSFCGARVVWRIAQLAAGQKYDLEGLCRRISGGRVSRVDRLSPREGFAMIEALKAIGEREVEAGGQTSPTMPGLFSGVGMAAFASPSRPAIAAGNRAAAAAGGLPEARVGAGMASGASPAAGV